MKKIIFILIVLALIGAGAFTYLYVTKPPPPTFPTDIHPTLPISFYSWKKPETVYALLQRVTNKGNPVMSPSEKYFAIQQKESIIISQMGKELHTIPFSKNIKEKQFFWITDQFLILVEKENSVHGVDNFYIIDIQNGEKQFFTGSFPVPDRLNLDKQIGVYENGHVLIMEDKKGNLWQLDVMF